MGTLHINVSDRLYSHLSQINERVLHEKVEEINNIGLELIGWQYNLSLSDAYMLINERNVSGTGQTAMEILQGLSLALHGAPPHWLVEHDEFKNRVFEEIIKPKAITFHAYLYNVAKLDKYVLSKDYYMSFQAVYYGQRTGYVAV